MVLIVDGNDFDHVGWRYSGQSPIDHHCSVAFSFQAEPIITSIPVGEFIGVLSFIGRSPTEHVKFIAVDLRTLDVYQQLAYAVLRGDRNSAGILADKVQETFLM